MGMHQIEWNLAQSSHHAGNKAWKPSSVRCTTRYDEGGVPHDPKGFIVVVSWNAWGDHPTRSQRCVELESIVPCCKGHSIDYWIVRLVELSCDQRLCSLRQIHNPSRKHGLERRCSFPMDGLGCQPPYSKENPVSPRFPTQPYQPGPPVGVDRPLWSPPRSPGSRNTRFHGIEFRNFAAKTLPLKRQTLSAPELADSANVVVRVFQHTANPGPSLLSSIEGHGT